MKKIKIQILSWLNGSVLFEYESEDNTVGKTLEEGVKGGAYLRGAYLQGAYLRGADLQGAKFKEPIFLSELYSLKLLPSETPLRFWKYTDDGKSPYQNAKYEVGKEYKFKNPDTNELNACGKGGNVASLMWCLRDSIGRKKIDLLEVEFEAGDIAAVPYWSDGKFRVKRFKILRKITRAKGVKLLKDITKL